MKKHHCPNPIIWCTCGNKPSDETCEVGPMGCIRVLVCRCGFDDNLVLKLIEEEYE